MGNESIEKRNIVILNHHAATPEVGGGGRHYQLSDCLSDKGYNLTILASSYSDRIKQYHYDEDIAKIEEKEKFNFVWIKTSPAYKGILGRLLNYYDYMKKASKYDDFAKKPDVIIASSVHPLAWTAGYRLSKKYNAKLIIEVRDLWPLSMYEDFSGLTRKVVFAFFESFERKYYRLADKIITTAPFAYEYIEEKYGVDRCKVIYIPHGIDISQFDKNLNINEDGLSKDLIETLNNHFCVTYTGALSKSEGLETLVESAKQLEKYKDLKVVIIGGGSEKEKLNAIIKREKLSNIKIFDKVSRDLIPLILSKSSILFCGLMDRKAFEYGISKNKFYDYMASKKPIIFASNVRGSLITESKAGITIPPHDPQKLADTILKLYENIDTLGKEYGKNGRKYVEENHTTIKIAEKFLEVIRSNNKF